MEIKKLDHKETLSITKVNEGDSLVFICPSPAFKGGHVPALRSVTASSIVAPVGTKNYVYVLHHFDFDFDFFLIIK